MDNVKKFRIKYYKDSNSVLELNKIFFKFCRKNILNNLKHYKN